MWCYFVWHWGCTSVISLKTIYYYILHNFLHTPRYYQCFREGKMRSQLMVLVLKFRNVKKYCILVLLPNYSCYCYFVAPLSLQRCKILLSLAQYYHCTTTLIAPLSLTSAISMDTIYCFYSQTTIITALVAPLSLLEDNFQRKNILLLLVHHYHYS